jgi:hypothetical protein
MPGPTARTAAGLISSTPKASGGISLLGDCSEQNRCCLHHNLVRWHGAKGVEEERSVADRGLAHRPKSERQELSNLRRPCAPEAGSAVQFILRGAMPRYDAFSLKKALLKSRQLGLLLGMSSGQCLGLFPN